MAGTEWTEPRRTTLQALCDTFVAAVPPPDVEAGDPTGFWGRQASDLGVPDRVAALLDTLPEEDRAGMLQLLDLLRASGFRHLPQTAREATVNGLRRASADVRDGLEAYGALTLMEFYGGVGPDGRNPNWDQLDYPGPPEVPQPPPPSLVASTPPVEDGRVTLEADVCVVGSGSGGGVVAGVVATSGQQVVVLEAGGHLEGASLPTDELTAYRSLYWRGGATLTDDGNVAIMAGATLGGGSMINWMNCVKPPSWVRKEWAVEHGLGDIATPAFDQHLDAVLERISANDQCSDLNGPNGRLSEGAEALDWDWHCAVRNADPSTYDPETAGHVGFGDRTGSKQGTLPTFLKDAAEAGAQVVVGCRAERILVDGGRAVGVEAVLTRDGDEVPVTVRCRHVVVACGALETPALLLRSGIGGPAVGRNLRVHPVPVLNGYYPEPQRAWWGGPQTAIVDEFSNLGDGHGFLVETPHVTAALGATAVPWRSARSHKMILGRSSELASFIAVTRDHAGGRVTIDDAGQSVVTYPIGAADMAQMRRSLEVMARLHVAAGARAMVDLHPQLATWRAGDDLDAYIARITALPFGAHERVPFSAHQMGTARMGDDPATSVADPEGQLHDTKGVWIGDTSAFPSAVGSNPMVTTMALAHRTAQALLIAAE